ncbi:MAG: hypothetical protein HYX80_03725 [Chloroflexi bacterium]|nr:hypothetical protein [Chloroflexota bacterium]
MAEKRYTQAEADFIFDWGSNWSEIADLLLSLFSHFGSPPFSPPPADLDDSKYRSLSAWFKEHEQQFIPLWKDFYESQDWALQPDDEELSDMPDTADYIRNPFHFAYRLENLSSFTHEFESRSWVENETTKSIERRAWTAGIDLVTMSARVVEFYKWICDRDI